nr:MAG TPA: hypothetical protein [Bacteriophage sp.]
MQSLVLTARKCRFFGIFLSCVQVAIGSKLVAS